MEEDELVTTDDAERLAGALDATIPQPTTATDVDRPDFGGTATRRIEDAYKCEAFQPEGGAVGSTPVRLQARGDSDDGGNTAGDNTSGTPLNHGAAMSGTLPTGLELDISGERLRAVRLAQLAVLPSHGNRGGDAVLCSVGGQH